MTSVNDNDTSIYDSMKVSIDSIMGHPTISCVTTLETPKPIIEPLVSYIRSPEFLDRINKSRTNFTVNDIPRAPNVIGLLL